MKTINFELVVLQHVKTAVHDYIRRIREYVMPDAFTETKFGEIEILLECNFLMSVLNCTTEYNFRLIVKVEEEMFYRAISVADEKLILKFTNLKEESIVPISINDIEDSLQIISFPYKYLNRLYRKDRLAADQLYTRYSQKNTPANIESKVEIRKRKFINKIKKAKYELELELGIEPDKSKVARKLGINVNTFNERLKNNEIKYHRDKKVFEVLETHEFI